MARKGLVGSGICSFGSWHTVCLSSIPQGIRGLKEVSIVCKEEYQKASLSAGKESTMKNESDFQITVKENLG